ncbi:MAG: hypothetical protein ACI8RA_000022 [Chlamydiales bacterium]
MLSKKLTAGGERGKTYEFKELLSSHSSLLKKRWIGSCSKHSFEEWFSQNYSMILFNKVRYLKARERKAFEISFIKDEAGSSILMRNGKTYDTSHEKTEYHGEGFAIFVVGTDKKLHCASHTKDEFHHSSFYAGRPVLCSGEIRTNPEGKLKWVINKSGHYRPSVVENLIFLKFLEENGIDLTKVKFGDYIHNSAYNASEYLLSGGTCPIE